MRAPRRCVRRLRPGFARLHARRLRPARASELASGVAPQIELNVIVCPSDELRSSEPRKKPRSGPIVDEDGAARGACASAVEDGHVVLAARAALADAHLTAIRRAGIARHCQRSVRGPARDADETARAPQVPLSVRSWRHVVVKPGHAALERATMTKRQLPGLKRALQYADAVERQHRIDLDDELVDLIQ
jgi:hypothetical protein